MFAVSTLTWVWWHKKRRKQKVHAHTLRMRYGQIVMGPAGSGKLYHLLLGQSPSLVKYVALLSTYCSNVVKHCHTVKRSVRVINLDPAAEVFNYPIEADIRDLISVDDVMDDEDTRLGPNGGLIFCMEYLIKNMEWLEEQLGEGEDDYYLFDCPGQIELYTHIPVMKQLVLQLQQWTFRLCGVFLLDSQFLTDAAKYFSGVMTSLSTMVMLELPHINVMGKLDLLDKKTKSDIERYLDPDTSVLLNELKTTTDKKFHKLNKAICSLIDDYSLVSFLPLDISDEDSLETLLVYIDNAIQYGEDLDVKVPKLAEEDEFNIEDTMDDS